jgi:glycosyltransferase involved in cell wall biosynthesis
LKIAFVHSKCRPFRYEIFEAIQERYDVDFYFLDEVVETLTNRNQIDSVKIPFMSDFHYAKNLRSKLEEKEYDIYISTDLGYHITYVTYSVAKKNNKKFVLWNEQWKNIIHPRRLLVTYSYENKILRNSDAVLAFGNKSHDFSIKRGAKKRKVVWAPNIVPSSYELKEPLSPESKQITILCIGRLIPIKGQDYLIKAFKQIIRENYDIKLIIAGEGPNYNKLKKLIKKLNLESSVVLTGTKVVDNEKWHLINNCDIFVLPSVNRRSPEAWGLVVNEAAMLKKPIITTNMTGVAGDIVKNMESGLVVTQKDVDELTGAIKYLLNNLEKGKEFGCKANILVKEKYNLDVFMKSFDHAIEIALSS